MSGVDHLRQQLRERGYLSHGIERWFALDPWSSRTFWAELFVVALKAAILIALFGILPAAGIMLFRNHPLTVLETIDLTLLYGAAWLAAAFLLVIGLALLLKARPSLTLDTPRALLGISFAAAAALVVPVAVWWTHFGASPSLPELVVGLALIVLFFLVATIVVSAALLSFSIYEARRIPAVHRRPRGVPMTIAAALLIAVLFIPAYAAQEKATMNEPLQVLTTPTTRSVALIAIDGLTNEIFHSRPELARDFIAIAATAPPPGRSTTERWASVGTGVPPGVHGVRAIEGVRLRGGRHLLQAVSESDFVLRAIAPAIGLATREALPPTVRRRDFVWEIFAKRGVPSAAVNWWTTSETHGGPLESFSQASILSRQPLAVDGMASRRLLETIDRKHPRFATAYLPALDIVLNRLSLDDSARLAASVRALDALGATIAEVRKRGYDVVLVGLPGDRQRGEGVLASTIAITKPSSMYDVAPTLLTLLGFPASNEMPGRPLVPGESPRIATYGGRAAGGEATKRNDEYYENLRSLGYIR